MMSGSNNEEERALREMSALADGECEPGQLLAACEAWRREPRARAAWHAYALIGDVMRSEDLASPADRDEDFLQRLRGRLADEPVVLAPMPAQVPRPELAAETQLAQPMRLRAGGASPYRSVLRRRWVSPAAVAAGLMMATGAMVVMRDSAGPESSVRQVATTAPVPRFTEPSPRATQDEVIRNAELDRYLAAHRHFSQGAALAMPGVIRQVAVNPGDR